MADQAAARTQAPGGDGPRRRYRKELGLWSVVFLATGAILGPAVGFTPVSVLGLAGPSGIISWIIAFALILALAMSYVELGTMWPRAGGVAYYPARSSGPIVGVMNAWGSFVGYGLAVPSIVVAFVEYLSYWWAGLYQNGTLSTGGILVAILTTLAIFYINTLRIRWIGQFNNVLTVATVLGLAVVIVAFLSHFHTHNFGGYRGFLPFGSSGLFLAITATIYGFGGFRQPIDYAEEVREPGKTIPLAVFITLIITLIVYALESFAFTGALNWAGAGVKPGDWAGLSALAYPLVSASHGVGLVLIGLVALVTTLIASFKDGYIYFGGSARVGHTLARYDRYLPAIFNRMTGNGIPIASVGLVLVVSVLYLLLLPRFSSLFPLVASALLLSYAPGPLSLAIFRRRHPDIPRPYRLPMASVLAPFSFVVSSLMVYWSGWNSIHILIPSVFVGLLLLFFYRKHRRITRRDVALGIWFPVYQGMIVLISFIGGTAFGGQNVIPFPWDNVVFAVLALGFYYVGFYCGLRCNDADVVEDTEPGSAGVTASGPVRLEPGTA